MPVHTCHVSPAEYWFWTCLHGFFPPRAFNIRWGSSHRSLGCCTSEQFALLLRKWLLKATPNRLPLLWPLIIYTIIMHLQIAKYDLELIFCAFFMSVLILTLRSSYRLKTGFPLSIDWGIDWALFTADLIRTTAKTKVKALSLSDIKLQLSKSQTSLSSTSSISVHSDTYRGVILWENNKGVSSCISRHSPVVTEGSLRQNKHFSARDALLPS